MSEQQRPILVMMMGLPKTGKSTFARKTGTELLAPVLSYRELSKALTGGAVVIPGVEARIGHVLLDTLGWYLLQGQTVIYDAGNLTRAGRAPFLQMAQALDAPVFGAWSACSESVQLARLIADDYPLEQAARIKDIWEPPSISEGFVQVISNFSDPEGGEVRLVKEEPRDDEL